MTKNSGKRRFVYVIWYAPAQAVKIGVTNVGHGRVRGVCANLPPGRSQLLFTLPNRGQSTEALLHRHFAEYRESGEWFSPVGALRQWVERHTEPAVFALLDLPTDLPSHTVGRYAFRDQCRQSILAAMAKLDPGEYPNEFQQMAGILARIYGVQHTVFEIEGHRLARLRNAAS